MLDADSGWIHREDPMPKLLTECLGTFFVVLTIGLAVTVNADAAPIAVGAVLASLIYMGAHVSGAHYNPAVSIALFAHGALSVSLLVRYLIAQLAGAALAAFAVHALLGATFGPAPGAGHDVATALGAEVLFTFALMLTIFHVGVSAQTKGNDYYGIAIALVVVAGAYVVGPVSGAAFNPAVAVGSIGYGALHGASLSDLWIYVVGPIVGALLAGVAYRIQEADDA